ncbi:MULTISPECIES: helix-turn-helix domain-containing protein [unclassified Undibacterium]|uniref:helix-turn-helix domain-containing protein n=1 Tax=unclassified Undibacterium TaxID=2630295 RepID=UPI002AC93525|nr:MULTISPECIES: helix-turn-helix domain-containing protein [unclassified Undibacterium]MEB0137614.1 helix-turn-helix domain-containing protein [Undibacterium sp. CCC2.1]MEB0170615.1 helix-turn-helix domain-containing protein [Undibacterium sp. CCC1.1]MEB0174556.1 helix-turn-helix domain-containing protein [Undibacterium sp. CCC3.4]MEB0213647.1 helix-turn-helix domain-containing protein [Undibacterium sp. 5I2]WPX43814.1 helix-turn-helix domain-containing protein [Undibacterium sp. CCC3.4]
MAGTQRRSWLTENARNCGIFSVKNDAGFPPKACGNDDVCGVSGVKNVHQAFATASQELKVVNLKYNFEAVYTKYIFKVVFYRYNHYAVSVKYRIKNMVYPIKTLQQIRTILVGFRKHAGLSQADVAKLLGVTQQSYAKIEANPKATSVERLFTILRLLGSDIVFTQNTKIWGVSDDPTTAPPVEFTDKESLSVLAEQSTKNPSSKMAIALKSKAIKKSHSAPSKVISPSGTKESW